MALVCAAGIFVFCGTSEPQSPTATIAQVTPADIKWAPFPALPAGAQIAMIYGNPFNPGLYVILLKLPPNYKNPPHSHPVEQVATVLSGTVYSGLGEAYDPSKLKMFPTGSLYTEPLNLPHFAETREEGVILQITGVGPLGTRYVNPADDPRKK